MSGPEEDPEVSCQEVLEDLYTYLDNECDVTAKARITQHLDDCAPCLRHYGIENEVKGLVGRCCGGEQAPDGLRERLLQRLKNAGVEG